ncbi:hypothetical protein U0070_027328, partial [Myodes glareolus]
GHAASGPRGVASHELHFRSVSGRRAPRRRHFRPDLRWQRRSRGRRSDGGGGGVSGLAEALARRFLFLSGVNLAVVPPSVSRGPTGAYVRVSQVCTDIRLTDFG